MNFLINLKNDTYYSIVFFAFLFFFNILSKSNSLNEKSIDLVIPVAYKDKAVLKRCLEGVLQNSVTPISKIYIISKTKKILNDLKLQTDKEIIFVSEDLFPFSKKDIEVFLKKRRSKYRHASWYYQQLLKFYAFKVIKQLADDFLILDSDFILIDKVKFLTQKGKAIFALGYPITNDNYINFAKKFIPGWKLMNSFNGVQHHMLFQKFILRALFDKVETYHRKDFWQAFLETIDVNQWYGASEYMMYFHFALQNYVEELNLRYLHTYDIIHNAEAQDDPQLLSIFNKLKKQPSIQAIGTHSVPNLEEVFKASNYVSPLSGAKKRKRRFLCSIDEVSSQGINNIDCQDFQSSDNQNPIH